MLGDGRVESRPRPADMPPFRTNGRWYRRIAKPLLDRLGALALLLVLAPVFLAIAAWIKIDSRGPVFYRATVIGRGGRPFTWWKFRSMQQNADRAPVRQQAMTQFAESRRRWNDYSTSYKVRDDGRVTRAGRLLRKFSLDELPQLFNVVTGSMSLVGPRPCLPREYEGYEPWQRERYSVTPGMTGVWQVHPLKNRMPLDETTLLDLYYARNSSLTMDISTLFETVTVVLRGTNES